jgi:hypothetical protein
MRSARLAVLLDICCVLVFVVIGRASHTKGETLAGIASTAWPFLTGLAAGWVVSRAWRRPLALRPAGIGAWLGAVAIGMVLRVVAGQGTAVAFIGVALAFLGLFLLGWRALSRVVSGRVARLRGGHHRRRQAARRAARVPGVEALGDAGDLGELVAAEHLDR